METINLHLGCGDKHIDGFINIDIRYLPSVDVIDDVKFLRKYANNSVDLIYTAHVLEHFSRWDYINVLQRWHDLLKPKGVLRLAVPDFESIVKHYLQKNDLKTLRGLLYGGQDYKENFHYCCWDFKTLSEDLKSCGFSEVKRYNWQETNHKEIDDFSQSYLPHMDKLNGQLMSLNVEAIK